MKVTKETTACDVLDLAYSIPSHERCLGQWHVGKEAWEIMVAWFDHNKQPLQNGKDKTLLGLPVVIVTGDEIEFSLETKARRLHKA